MLLRLLSEAGIRGLLRERFHEMPSWCAAGPVIGRHVEQLAELLRLRLADRPLLTTSDAMPREPNTSRRSRWRRPCYSIRLRNRLSGAGPWWAHGQEFGILPLFRREVVIKSCRAEFPAMQ